MAVAATTALLLPAEPAHAQKIDEAKALQVKAAYLYKLPKFLDWPVSAYEGDPKNFVIGVLGEDPFGRILDDTIRAKTVGSRPVKVRRLRWTNDKDRAALKRCQVLFISASERHRLGEVLAELTEQPVLLVSDIPDFASMGGMIGLVLEEGRIVFEINVVSVERAGLHAQSKLLRLARIVEASKDGQSKAAAKTEAPGESS
jgi:hypothetical protein